MHNSYNSVSIFLYFVWDHHEPCGMDKLFAAAKFIFYSNASLNPCVYVTLSERYRRVLKDLTKGLCSKRVHTNVINSDGHAVNLQRQQIQS